MNKKAITIEDASEAFNLTPLQLYVLVINYKVDILTDERGNSKILVESLDRWVENNKQLYWKLQEELKDKKSPLLDYVGHEIYLKLDNLNKVVKKRKVIKNNPQRCLK